jgi:hypothetical protein
MHIDHVDHAAIVVEYVNDSVIMMLEISNVANDLTTYDLRLVNVSSEAPPSQP